MSDAGAHEHLSHITTLWTLVYRAHRGETPLVANAQQVLVERYSGAVHRYLLGALRDPEAADELFQEFCLRFLRGDFCNASAERGRFRDYLKTAVFHLIVDYQKRRQKQPQPLVPGIDEPAVEPPSIADSDREFLNSWRQELMSRTWLALKELEQRSGQPHHTVLEFRTSHSLTSSEQMAEQIGARLGKAFSVHAIRQALHRAREKFAECLLEEVARSLADPSREQIEAELLDLELLSHCRASFERRYPA